MMSGYTLAKVMGYVPLALVIVIGMPDWWLVVVAAVAWLAGWLVETIVQDEEEEER